MGFGSFFAWHQHLAKHASRNAGNGFDRRPALLSHKANSVALSLPAMPLLALPACYSYSVSNVAVCSASRVLKQAVPYHPGVA